MPERPILRLKPPTKLCPHPAGLFLCLEHNVTNDPAIIDLLDTFIKNLPGLLTAITLLLAEFRRRRSDKSPPSEKK